LSVELASAYVRIRPNMSGFKSETEAGVKSAFAGVGKIIGVALGVGAGLNFGKEIFSQAGSLQKSVEAIRADFGSASGDVTKFGEDAGKSFGISANLADTTSARFGILFKNLGVGQSAAAEMTVGFEKLAGSIAAIRGIDPATVLQNLPLAAAGNLRSLKQLGIAVDANTLKLAAYKLGLISTTTQALTPAQRAEAIYAIATSQLGDYIAQANAHAGDAANVQRRLSAEWANAKDELGAGLLPVVAKLGTELGDHLPAAVDTVKKDFADAKSVIQAVSAPLGGVTNAVKGLVAAWAAFKVAAIADAIRNDLVARGTAILSTSSAAAAKAVASEGTAASAAVGPNVALAGAVGDVAAASAKLDVSLGASALALKTAGVATAAGTAEKAAVSETAAASSAKLAAVGLLGVLRTLAGIGIITIGIELIVNRKGVDKTVGNLLDKAGLGFLGGTKEGQLSPADLKAKAQQEGGFYAAAYKSLEDAAAKGNKDAIKAVAEANPKTAASIEASEKAAFGTNFQKQTSDNYYNAIAGPIVQGVSKGTKDGTAAAITQAKQNLADLQSQLDAAIQQRTLDIQQSVTSAKQNLQSIGATLAQSIGAVLDQPLTNLQNQLSAQQNKLSLEQLRRSVLLPGGKSLSTDPNKAISELKSLAARATDATRPAIQAFLVQYEQAALSVQQDQVNRQKIAATQSIADLTDLYNKHQITASQLQTRLLALLQKDGVNYKKAGDLLGVSFADGFRAQVKGILEQAAAIAASPQLAGSGQEPNIIRPYLEIQKENRDIAKQELEISKKRLALETKIEKAATATAVLTQQLAAVNVAPPTTSSSKNPGDASKKTTKLRGSH